jgi:transcriptional regulator with XRE-family HTH domain
MTNYKETYGYKLAQSRDSAGWTQGQLAEAINTHKKKTYTIAVTLIHEWEANKRVPRNEQIELITDVLAEKLQLDASGKQQLLKEFLDRAAITREVVAAGGVASGRTHFGNLLREKMEAADINETSLAEVIRQKAGKPYSFDDIYQIEHGLAEPSEEFTKLATLVIERKPPKHNIVNYVLNLLGEDEFRRIKNCGDVAIQKLDQGFVDNETLRKILVKAKDNLTQAKHLDAEGKFVEGEYQGQNYLELIAAENQLQTGKTAPQR